MGQARGRRGRRRGRGGVAPMEGRHSRTDLFGRRYAGDPGRLRDLPVVIAAGPGILRTGNGREMFETAANLVCRFSDNVGFGVPEGMPGLESRAGEIASGAGAGAACAGGEPEVAILIGDAEAAGRFSVRIDSSGWVSYMACGPDPEPPCLDPAAPGRRGQNPIGAMGAACLASAEAFKRLLEVVGAKDDRAARIVSSHPRRLEYSFLSCRPDGASAPLPAAVDVGNVLLVGAGAVGSGFLYAASRSGVLRGDVTALDHDTVDETNLNRCLPFYASDVGAPKAGAVERLSSEGLRIRGVRARYREFGGRKAASTVVSAVDNNAARAEIQYDLPRVIFHGATGDAGADVSVIRFGENACMRCMFRARGSWAAAASAETGIPEAEVRRLAASGDAFTRGHLEAMGVAGDAARRLEKHVGRPFVEVYAREICGMVRVRAEGGAVHASVPFVSFFAGLSLLSEVAKHFSPGLRGYPMPNGLDLLEINLFSPGSCELSRKPRDPGCDLCSDAAVLQIWRDKWAGAGPPPG